MIRLATIKDAEAVYKLLKQISKLHYGLYPDHFFDDSPKYSLEEVNNIIEDEKIITIVYTLNKDVVGYIIGWISDDCFFVDDLCIDETKRGNQIGQKLMEYIEENYDNVRLNVWAKNIGAVNFYKRLGYEPLKYVMEKRKK